MAIEIIVCDTPASRAQLFAFRHRIWADELGAEVPGVSNTDTLNSMFDAVDLTAINYAAINGDQIIGSFRVTDLHLLENPDAIVARYHVQDLRQLVGTQAIAHVGRLAVDRSARGGTCLFMLLAKAMRDCINRGIRAVCFDCSPYLLRTYEALGAVRTGPAFDDPMLGFKIPLALINADQDYFQHLQSPLARAVTQVQPDPIAVGWRKLRSSNPLLMPASDPKTLLEYIDECFINEQILSQNLLSGLSYEQRQQLLARSTIFSAAAGQEVIKPGLREDAVFLCLAGTLAVIDEEHPELMLQTLEAGEFFGEMAWLTGASRHNRVRAQTACEILLISADVLRSLFDKMPAIAAIILRNMARTLALRLQAISLRLAPD
jgi:CRP-like cAMP-binding protein/predicted GNAT family N-acyltransferase